MGNISSFKEPNSYAEAQQFPEWQSAMRAEIDALEKNGTWTVVSLPPDKKAIGCKWVFKTKLKADGTIERHKARLVAKGYNQVEGVDFSDSYSPVAKSVTVRLFLALAAAKGWLLHQLDVNNAFLHGDLDEDVYMLPPPGYSKVVAGQVCKLNKSLYGLKQASRQWNIALTQKLLSFGFSQSKHDNCLFTRTTAAGFISLLVYVDDVLIASDNSVLISQVKEFLDAEFTIKDLGVAKYFLGLEIARSSRGIYINQRKYTLDLISDAGLSGARPVDTPMIRSTHGLTNQGILFKEPERYRRLIGRLLYLGFTRPDIAYATQCLSQFMQQPCEHHWEAALHILRYLKNNPACGLFFAANHDFKLTAYCDVD